MKVALLYPPPWKLSTGETPMGEEGAPPDYQPGDLDADFYQIPYGLLTLAAEARRAGHAVKVLNLSRALWSEVDSVLQALDADVVGLSCWTANRRGVGYVAAAAKALRRSTHVVVGGPHATALPEEMLKYHRDIDTIVVGEGEATFLELLATVAVGASPVGLAGTVTRAPDGAIVRGAKRKNIEDLDVLASPHEHFSTHILMTSRGCPWSCTFCGAETSWGRGFRSHSNAYVMGALRSSLARLPVRQIQIKDDTFTTNKKRVRELCALIREEKLQFLWSCDTRVDVLDEDLLREMRLAGCQRLSLGVETGSQTILDRIQKKITKDEIREATLAAKRVGIKVRWYMMLGNRGETEETFRETREFLSEVRPHEFLFSCLSIYPGTQDFYEAEKTWLDRACYFREPFQELKTPFDCDEKTLTVLDDFFRANKGLRQGHRDTLAELEAISARLGPHHAASMDLGAAHFHHRNFEVAADHIHEALALGWPAPGLAFNHLAAISYARGDVAAMQTWFARAVEEDGQHWVLRKNLERVSAWIAAGQAGPLALDVRHDFQLLEIPTQPTLPGPLAADFATWGNPSQKDERPAAVDGALPPWAKTPEREGSGAPLKRHLPLRER